MILLLTRINYPSTRAKALNQRRLCCALVGMLITLSSTVCATQTVAMEGTVTFSDGRLVKMALISLRSADGEVDRSTRADDNGHYVFEEIPPGNYFMVIFGGNSSTERTGTFFRDDIVVQSSTPSPVTVDAVLEDPS